MLERAARLGYASKAVIYGIVGVLAVLTAVRRGGALTDTSGALLVVLTRPFGRTLLVILAVGLCGYAVWRLADAIADPDRDGTSVPGLVNRIGNAVRGCVYGALGLEAVRLLRGFRASTGNEAELWTARIFDIPFGEILVGIIGVIVAAYAVTEMLSGIRGTHDAKLDWSPIPPALRTPLQRVCRFGVTIRGGLLATLSVFLVRAAWFQNPNAAADPRESLMRFGGLFEGRWWLATVAIGVIAYAVDQAVHARCRRIRAVI